MIDAFKVIGALGLVLIAGAILVKKREREDLLYIFGGLCLEAYSLHIGDWIFIILQMVVILAGVYDLTKLRFFEK